MTVTITTTITITIIMTITITIAITITISMTITCEVKCVSEVAQHFQEELIIFPEKLSGGLLVQARAATQKLSHRSRVHLRRQQPQSLQPTQT